MLRLQLARDMLQQKEKAFLLRQKALTFVSLFGLGADYAVEDLADGETDFYFS